MKRMMLAAGVLALGLPVAAMAADTCSLSGPYLAGVLVETDPVVLRFSFDPPADCDARGHVILTADGYQTVELRYRVSPAGAVTMNLPWFGDEGPQVLSGSLASGGFAFEGSGIAGTALAE